MDLPRHDSAVGQPDLSGSSAFRAEPAIPSTSTDMPTTSPTVYANLDHNDDIDSDEEEIVEPSMTDRSAHPLPFISGSSRSFSLRNLLNPSHNNGHQRHVRSGRATHRTEAKDVVSLGLISQGMAQQLYNL